MYKGLYIVFSPVSSGQMSTLRKKEIQQVCQLSYLQQLCWKSLPRMWDLAEHPKWSIALLIMVVPLAEDRWHMRKHAVLLQMVCISYQERWHIYLRLSIEYGLQVTLLLQSKEIAPFRPKSIMSAAVFSTAPIVFLMLHVIRPQGPLRETSNWETEKQRRNILMHEQSNKECPWFCIAYYRFSSDRKDTAAVGN